MKGHAMQSNKIQYNVIPNNTIKYNTILCTITQYNEIPSIHSFISIALLIKQPPDTSLPKPSVAKLEMEILSVQEALLAKEPIQDSVHFTVKSKDEKRDWRQKKTQDSRTEAVAKKKRS